VTYTRCRPLVASCSSTASKEALAVTLTTGMPASADAQSPPYSTPARQHRCQLHGISLLRGHDGRVWYKGCEAGGCWRMGTPGASASVWHKPRYACTIHRQETYGQCMGTSTQAG
jgi:hypothetical protein